MGKKKKSKELNSSNSNEETIKKQGAVKSLLKRILFLSIFLLVATPLTIISFRYIVPYLGPGRQELKLNGNLKRLKTRSRAGTYMKIRNVYFRLTDKIAMKIDYLNAEAIPRKGRKIINFDDVNSFSIDILQGKAYLTPRVLEVLFNDYVFNFKGSPLKNEKMSFIDFEVDGKKVKRLKLEGEMLFLGIWLNFEMIAKMTLDKKKVLMIIEAEQIKTMGNPYTKSLLGLVGLNLQKLMPVPDGRGIQIIKNKIFVNPFAIMPPPKIGGYITGLEMTDKNLIMTFDNPKKIKFPKLPKKVKNYLLLYKGDVKFGKLMMIDAMLQMVDMDQKDIFDFYLKNYFKALVKGKSKIRADKSVVAYLPDYK